MNLKEAFRFQNKLRELSAKASDILAVTGNVLRIEVTYLRSKIDPDAENETVVRDSNSPYAGYANELVDFLLYLLDQRSALGKAVRAAKAGLDLDMDLETGLNAHRQSLAATFRKMAGLRSAESLLPNGGTGYRFNAEGNQVTYQCDAKMVTTINFDRNKVKKLATRLHEQADDISSQLDVILVTTQVDYRPPFNVNDTFESVFEQFCEEHGAR